MTKENNKSEHCIENFKKISVSHKSETKQNDLKRGKTKSVTVIDSARDKNQVTFDLPGECRLFIQVDRKAAHSSHSILD